MGMKREIVTTVEIDGEIYIFRIQREIYGDLTITTTPTPGSLKIQGLIDVMINEANQLL